MKITPLLTWPEFLKFQRILRNSVPFRKSDVSDYTDAEK